jgi:hypothetical protein
MEPGDREKLQEMKSKIEAIEKLALELKGLGEGLPVIEKNARNILSTTYCLKFGISDVVDTFV